MFVLMSFDEKERWDPREAEEDDIYAKFFGHKDIQPTIVKIAAHLRTVLTEQRYLNIVNKVETEHDGGPFFFRSNSHRCSRMAGPHR